MDAQLRDPPAVVTAFFSEALDPRLSSLQVLDGAGRRVDSGRSDFGPDPAQMSTTIPEPLPPAFYIVVWETLSDIDGHLLKGSFPFTVLNPDGSQPSGPKPEGIGVVSGGEPTWEVVLAKWLGLSAAVMLVGGLAFAVWVLGPASRDVPGRQRERAREAGRRHLERVAWPALGLLALAGAAELVVQTRQLGGPAFADDVLRTVWGERWLQRQAVLVAAGLAFGLAGWLRRARRHRLSEAALWTALAGGLGYLALVAMVSHGASVRGSFWAVAADFVHLAAAAVWTGMLAQLALLFLWARRAVAERERPVLLAAHLRRFSVVAATSVALLLASGSASALTHVPSPQGMIDTPYGRVLTAKLSLMGVLLAVAGANAVLLAPRLSRPPGAAAETLARRLSALVRLEAALAVAVLLVAAVLVQYPTSRQERDAEANVRVSTQAVVGYEEVAPAGDLVVDLSIAPNVVGTNSFQVFLFPPPGGEVGDVQRVRLRFKPPDPALGPSESVAEVAGPSFYKAIGAFLVTPGPWEVQVDIRRRQVDDVSAFFPVEVVGTGPGRSGSGRFDLPLTGGGWAGVGAAGTLLAALLLALWARWPRLPWAGGRALRVGGPALAVVGAAFLAESLLPGAVTDGTASGNPIASSPTSVAIGRTLYGQNCAQCHGEEGRGDGSQAAALEVPPADFRIHIPLHSDEFFFRVIGGGLGKVMPSFGGQLSEEERWHLINFLKEEFGSDVEPDGR